MQKENRIQKLSNLQFFLMMMLAIVFWALAFPFIQIGLDKLSFINLTIMRFFIVCITFLILIALKRNWFSKIHKKDIPSIFLLGFFGVMVYHFGLNYGEQYITAGAASLIIATSPVYIVILAAVFLKEKITFFKFLGIILALFGVIIISILGKQGEKIQIQTAFAAIAVLIAAIVSAFYTIAGKKLLSRYNGLSLTAYAILFGSIILVPLSIFNTSLINEVSNMQPVTWFAVIFLGVFSTVIGYGIWYMALEIKTASEISVYLYAIPVLSTIASYLLFKDTITIFFILGGIFVIIGIVLVNMKQKNSINKK
ncbi:MAG: DMT family transporter [Candidatus Thermoplasmatota archaeon]|nr:DMT family transporter [Candidatus Thermoplasmatota archaeon]